MATPITTKPARSRSRQVRLPGWLWFVALWCGGVGGAMIVGYAFKALMNATLFAITCTGDNGPQTLLRIRRA